MGDAHYTLYPRPRWTSGALTCLVLFAFGSVLLWGLFRAPRAHAPQSPDVPWGVPPRAVRVVCLDLGYWRNNFFDAAELIDPLRADFVLAQQVPGEAVLPLAERLGMQRSFHPNNYARVGPDDGAAGCLVLSRHALYDAAPLYPQMRGKWAYGVWAAAVVDGKKFALVSADGAARLDGAGVPAFAAAAALDARQKEARSPPVIAAFRAPEMDSTRSQMLTIAGLTDALPAATATGAKVVDGCLIATAGPWRVSAESAGRPHRLAPGILWVELADDSGQGTP